MRTPREVVAMPDDDESRRFEDIVSDLRDERLGAAPPRRRGRAMFLIGIALCVTAVAIFLLGGGRGAVIAVFPWILGMLLVVAGRSRD